MFQQIIHRCALGAATGALLCSLPLSAATLAEVFAQAWSDRAQTARSEQYDARLSASQSWTPEPPTLSVSGRSDRLDTNDGLREWEAEISQALWLPEQREHAGAVAKSEREAGVQRFLLERWQLAGELREAWWEAHLAQIEQSEAERKLLEMSQLEVDVDRRVRNGELAPLDLNRIRSRVVAAKADELRAKAAVTRATQQFLALSKGALLPDQPEVAAAQTAGDAPSVERHPALAVITATASSAQAKLRQARGDTRDAPEISVTVTRERGSFGEPYQNLTKLTLKIPFGSESRNQPRVTAANADWVEAQLAAEQTRRKVEAGLAASRAEVA